MKKNKPKAPKGSKDWTEQEWQTVQGIVKYKLAKAVGQSAKRAAGRLTAGTPKHGAAAACWKAEWDQIRADSWAAFEDLDRVRHGFRARTEADAFYAKATKEGRAPQKSLRFYPAECTYDEYNDHLADSQDKFIGFLHRMQARVETQMPASFSVGKKAAASNQKKVMRENQLYFDFAAEESPAAAMQFFTADLAADNYMLEQSKFAAACQECRVVPLVDICSDVLGTNSLCPFHLSPI